MGSFSIWHWLVVLAIILLMFGGRGKISQLMGDFGKGLSAFKKGVSGDNAAADPNKPTEPATPGDDAKTIGQSTTAASASPASSHQAKT
ncbi:MAG: twin-arginine translocase TatA/TatE family subunit [Alphaproteobacteria bacterium]|nr:twin-arginine translocase TatA/TatE family subunit [Alphaproteobacteria bacterium]MCW5743069.1 twin-arginine translocase TatA/TatE family subunit [Alphaproteobacteria bacterium]